MRDQTIKSVLIVGSGAIKNRIPAGHAIARMTPVPRNRKPPPIKSARNA